MSPAHSIPVYLSLLAPVLTLFFSLTVCASDPLPLPLLLTLFLHCPSFLSFFLSFCLCVFTALSIYLSVIFWSLLSPLSIFYNPSFAPLLSSIPSCISLYFTLFILSPLAYYLSICMSFWLLFRGLLSFVHPNLCLSDVLSLSICWSFFFSFSVSITVYFISSRIWTCSVSFLFRLCTSRPLYLSSLITVSD